ncbi:hypothetical protein R6Z07M_017620 [Ovis aries]
MSDSPTRGPDSAATSRGSSTTGPLAGWHRMHLGWWRRKLEKKKHRSEHGGEASHQCHLGPVSSLSLERWFQHLKHQGEEGADGRRTAELRVVTKLLDGRTLKTRGQRALTGDSSRKASPLRLPKRGELQGDRQVSKPLAWGCCHGPAQENLGSRWWSWYGWMDTPGMLSSSLSLTVALSLRGSRPPPCEELGPFLTSKPAASLASPHDPACNLLTEGRASHTGTDGYGKILHRVPCAVQQAPAFCVFYAHECVSADPKLLLHPAPLLAPVVAAVSVSLSVGLFPSVSVCRFYT